MHDKFCQYTSDTIEQWVADQEEPTYDIFIGGLFFCSSTEVLNLMLDDLGRTIDDERGLKRLTITNWFEEHELQEWPLEQLALKCHHLESLQLSEMDCTKNSNSILLLEFAGRAITNSSCFSKLHIKNSGTTATEGEKFLQVLADDQKSQLQSLVISLESKWFKDTDQCMGPLLSYLARQTGL